MSKNSNISITNCLFDAFANSQYFSPQNNRQLWALIEGIRRIDPALSVWKPKVAHEIHHCVKGCSILNGDTYFTYQVDFSVRNKIRICAKCTAMLLYFLKVEYMHFHKYTHWNSSQKKPVNLDISISDSNIQEYSKDIKLERNQFNTFSIAKKDKSQLNKKLNNPKNSFPDVRKKYPRAYERWTKYEENKLIALFKSKVEIKEIANSLERKVSAINSKLIKLGLIKI